MVEHHESKTKQASALQSETAGEKQGIPQNVWLLHGKQYDFSPFINRHPGGKDMILLGRGRDCTELFESVHVLSSGKPRALLSKYEIRTTSETSKQQTKQDEENTAKENNDFATSVEQSPDDLFVWEKDGFYATLSSRVKTYLQQNQLDYKAPWTYYAKLIAMMVVIVYSFYQALYKGSIFFAVVAGLVEEMLHFCTMHDGSHSGISHNPAVNKLFCAVTYWFFFDPWIWLRHHVYGHHCYTGIHRKDPDLTNSKLFARKHHETTWKPAFNTQHWHIWFWMMIFPNQHWAQTLVYKLAPSKKKVFGVPIEKKPDDILKPIIVVTSIFFHFGLPLFYISFGRMLLVNFFLWSVIGSTYFLVVLPNHDTDLVLKSAVESDKKIDWGEQQVRHTSNHSINYDGNIVHKIVTLLFGGMNFQIEHHLFPSMSHEHYAKIAPIVQQTCKEFNIPYNVNESWFGAVAGHFNMLKILSSKNPTR